MIDDRSQYEYIEIDDDIRVDGGIMPARDKAGDGSWAVLRGEDIAFATEAVKERCRAVAYDEDLRSQVTSEVRSDAWTDLIVCMSHVCHDFARQSAAIEPVLRATPIPSATTLANLFPSIPFQFSDLMASPSDFGKGQPLRADGVRRVFHDIGIMTRWPVNCTFSRVGSDYAITDVEGVPGDATATGVTVLEHVASDFRGTHINTEGSKTATISGGGFSVLPVSGSFAHAGLIEMEMRDRIINDQGVVSETVFYYAFPFDGEGDGGGSVFVSFEQIATVARNALQGYFKTGLNVGSLNAQTTTARVMSARALVTLDEHTDFSEIGWNWPGNG